MITKNKATPAHSKEIAALETLIFGSTAWSEKAVEDELQGEHRTYWVLQNEALEIVGYTGLLVLGSDADVQTIAVAEELRGGGYGKLLLETLLEEAKNRGAKNVFLEVRDDNYQAQSLYKKYGFETIAKRQGYYQPEGVDALIMQLKLSGSKSVGPIGGQR